MLNQVPAALRTASRIVILRHPNAVDCQVWRKTVQRTEGAEAGAMGGLPTMGGMGVLDAEDEPDVSFELLGEGRVLFSAYQPSSLSDARDTAMQTPAEAQVIAVDPDATWEAKDSDLIMAMPGSGVVLTYEVTRVVSTCDIPPYVTKVEVNAQLDLMFIPGVAANQAART